MLDLARVEGFEWDTGNAGKNDRHSVNQQEAEQVFFNQPLLLIEDPKHSASEPRYHALGKTFEERLLHIAFTLRAEGKSIRVISARPMHRKERMVYGQTPEIRP
jgi:uncharacterized DUF497 family protein